MRLPLIPLLVATLNVACSSTPALAPAVSDAGDDDAASVAGDDATNLSCSSAGSLDAFCCDNASGLFAACPNDFASFAAICGQDPPPPVVLALNSTACAGFVFANASGEDTGFIFAFDAVSGRLRAVLRDGIVGGVNCAAADQGVVIPWTCLDNEYPRDGGVCNAGKGPKGGPAFATFCSTTSAGDPPCAFSNYRLCPYPTSCAGGKCQYIAPVDGGSDEG